MPEAGRVQSLCVSDCDQFAELVPAANNRFLQLGGGRSEGTITRLDLGSLIVVRIKLLNLVLCEAAAASERQYTVVPLSWRGELSFDGRQIEGPSLLAWGPNGSYVRRGRDVELCGLLHKQEDLLAAAETWSGRSPEAWKGYQGEFIPLQRGRDDFFARLSSVLETMACRPEVFESPRLRSLVGDSITTSLLAAAESAGLDSTQPARSFLSHDRIVRVCQEYLNSHPTGQVTKLDLCRAAGVSARSLQDAFRTISGLPPSEFLKSRRLQEARRLLREGDPESTAVKQCALEAGFWELGRFAVEYRQRFGESPSETLRARTGRLS